MNDDESDLEEKLDRLAGEARTLRWTLVGCTFAVCVTLAAGRDAGAAIFVISAIAVFFYVLVKLAFAFDSFFRARREFDRENRLPADLAKTDAKTDGGPL